MTLIDQINLLATRVGTEIKTLRNASVPISQRGPIGGVSSASGVTGTITIDPATSSHRRLTLTGDTTIAAMGAGAEGQRVLFEATASGANRTLTFDPAFEMSQAVTTRTFTIPSGAWGYVQAIYRAGTWRLVSAEPQTITGSSATPSDWTPSDHNMLAWTADPALISSNWTTTDGGTTWAALKLDTTATVNYVWCSIATPGAGLTAGTRNQVGVYDSTLALRASTVDQAGLWTSTGNKMMSLSTAVTLSAGTYYVLFMSQGTTRPAFTGQPISASPQQAGRTSTIIRAGNSSVAQTSLPATRPTATAVPTAYLWAAFA